MHKDEYMANSNNHLLPLFNTWLSAAAGNHKETQLWL